MFKILKDDPKYKQVTLSKIRDDFPNLAHLMINTKDNFSATGVMLSPIGDLYAVADQAGLTEFYSLVRDLNESDVLVDTVQLDSYLSSFRSGNDTE